MENASNQRFYVSFFGRFSLRFEDKEIVITKPLKQKKIQLLLLLLMAGDKGIARRKLVEKLESGIEGWEKQLNNLRQQVYALRRMLKKLENMPDSEYVVISGTGTFYFNREFAIETDISRIELLNQKLKRIAEPQNRLKMLKEICLSYQEGFLPHLSEEEWVLMEEARYQGIYSRCMKEICTMLEEQGEYTELLELATRASQLYPYDEWQSVQIECLAALGRYKEAMKICDSTNEQICQELGVWRYDQDTGEYKKLREQPGLMNSIITEIQHNLEEEGSDHKAYYCSNPAFTDIYRVVTRMLERNEYSAALMVCTLDEKTKRAGAGIEDVERQMERFKKCLEECIRSSDVYTRYSLNQFLVLLVGTEENTGKEVVQRLRELWDAEEKEGRMNVEILTENLETTLSN